VRKGLFILAAFVLMAPGAAHALTLQQESLIGLPARVAVVTSSFDDDGTLTRDGVKKGVEDLLAAAKFSVVEKRSAPPIAFVNVHIARQDAPEGKSYLIDVNVYSDAVITTAYRIRKGTVWMMGSEKVIPGKYFPDDVMGRVEQMVRFFIEDYRAANPGVSRQE
jgi:hypothetical protein